MAFIPRLFGHKPRPLIRSKQSSLEPTPDNDGVLRYFSKKLWEEGTTSKYFLELAGLSPDDLENHFPTMELLNARHEARLASQQETLRHFNEQFPKDAKLAAYAMMPWSLWGEGGFAKLLWITCDLFAVDSWNTMLLPEGELGSQYHGLPVHPGSYPDAYLESLKIDFEKMHNHSEMMYEYNDKLLNAEVLNWEEIVNFSAGKRLIVSMYIKDIKLMATSYSKFIFGEEVFSIHEKSFGQFLRR